ncbi:hypothetical protein V1477_001324 [Vespula maculifrons]|uniref:Uncharacterized protein n=1 Tax=Vespula maculifrons TaxID=7453 RepID=A0ABD2CZG1_VESMC
MAFRFGSFELRSKLEMYKTPLTDCSTVHTVGFRHLETRPVVSILRYFKEQNEVLDFRYNLDIDFNISQVLPTQVPPRGGSCIWGPTG